MTKTGVSSAGHRQSTNVAGAALHPHPARWNRNLGCVVCLKENTILRSHAYELWCRSCLEKAAGHIARIAAEAREMRKAMKVTGEELRLRRVRSRSLMRTLGPKVKKRDDYTCQICGERDPDSTTVDHIRPLNFGGTDDLDNLRVLCHRCNSKKGARPYTNTGDRQKAAEYITKAGITPITLRGVYGP